MEQFLAKDKRGEDILINIERVDPLSEDFSKKMQEISDVLAKAYMPVEVSFARQFPDSLAGDRLLHSLDSLFKKNPTQPVIEEKTNTLLKEFFAHGFVAGWSANKKFCSDYIHFLVTAKAKKTDEVFGALYFLVSATGEGKMVRVPIFGVSPAAQQRGIGKLLMCSILKEVPDTKKIMLSTRITNEEALTIYQAWGFTPSPKTMEYWTDLEYLATLTSKLQKAVSALH